MCSITRNKILFSLFGGKRKRYPHGIDSMETKCALIASWFVNQNHLASLPLPSPSSHTRLFCLSFLSLHEFTDGFVDYVLWQKAAYYIQCHKPIERCSTDFTSYSRSWEEKGQERRKALCTVKSKHIFSLNETLATFPGRYKGFRYSPRWKLLLKKCRVFPRRHWRSRIQKLGFICQLSW